MTAVTDTIKRLVNTVFVAYDWKDAIPNDMVADPIMVDVYTEECSSRVLTHIMDQLDEEVVSIGDGFNLSDSEREQIRKRLRPAVEQKCQLIVKDEIARMIRERMAIEVMDKENVIESWSDRSIEDYTEPMAADDIAAEGGEDGLTPDDVVIATGGL